MSEQQRLAPLGHTVWHSSDEDGGPDVGIGMQLPDGSELYFGELANETIEGDGVDPKGVGWCIAHITDGEIFILGTKCAEAVHEDERVDGLARAMKPARAPTEAERLLREARDEFHDGDGVPLKSARQTISKIDTYLGNQND